MLGSFGPEDCINDVVELKLERPVTLKEGVKYAVRLRNFGGRTLSGDGGLQAVKCLDGVVFSFSPCSLSTNGTNHTRYFQDFCVVFVFYCLGWS